MGRAAVVITFDEPDNISGFGDKLDTIKMQMRPVLQGLGNGSVWVGIRESAEDVMRATGEIE